MNGVGGTQSRHSGQIHCSFGSSKTGVVLFVDGVDDCDCFDLLKTFDAESDKLCILLLIKDPLILFNVELLLDALDVEDEFLCDDDVEDCDFVGCSSGDFIISII